MSLVSEPLVTMPIEKSANAPIVIAPSPAFINDRGFFTTLADAMADNPLSKKAVDATALCAIVQSFVKMPTPMAPKAIKKSSLFTVLVRHPP